MSPLPDAGGGHREGLTIVFNGEIYNFRELRAELVAQGHQFHSGTDTEVLLHLYERDGLAMFASLNGMYAFALHDDRDGGQPAGVHKGDLLIARDQLGVKPLYYAALERGVLFGSEAKALLPCRELSRELDYIAIHQTLAYLWTPAPSTALKHVRKLEPGCALIVRDGRVQRNWRYFELPYDGVRHAGTEAQIAEELAAHLETAVRRQLVADVPIGAYLSGGLDSSSVVAMMRRVNPEQRPTCFCIGFGEGISMSGNPDDLPYARRVAAHLGVPLEEIRVESSIINRMDELIALLDEPQADPAPLNALIVAEHARLHGIPVLMSGVGGDDIFSGFRRHLALGAEKWWGWTPGVFRRAIQHAARMSSSGAFASTAVPFRRAAKALSYASLNGDQRLISYFWWSTEALRSGLYSRAFADHVGSASVSAPLLQSLERIPRERDPLQRMLFLETKHFLADHNLNYSDRAGMAVGVEVRVPLLDIDLVSFAASVPPSLKQQGRVGKAIFKRAMRPYLPNDVIYRPKSGFGVPLRHWLSNELRPLVDETLDEVTVRKRGLFEPKAVRKLIDLDRAGRVDGAYTIFALMCIELWCRRFHER